MMNLEAMSVEELRAYENQCNDNSAWFGLARGDQEKADYWLEQRDKAREEDARRWRARREADEGGEKK